MPNRKLTEDQVNEIYNRYWGAEPYEQDSHLTTRELAVIYKVSHVQISRIVSGQSRKKELGF